MRYLMTLRNGKECELSSGSTLLEITQKLSVTPATVLTAPFWVLDGETAVLCADVVAVETMEDR